MLNDTDTDVLELAGGWKIYCLGKELVYLPKHDWNEHQVRVVKDILSDVYTIAYRQSRLDSGLSES